jgi:hypothetical protein
MSWLLAAGTFSLFSSILALSNPPILGGRILKFTSSEHVALVMDVILHFVFYSFLTDAQLSCQQSHGPLRILIDELLEGGQGVVVQGVAPPRVVLPLRAEVLWEAIARNEFCIALFEAFCRAM